MWIENDIDYEKYKRILIRQFDSEAILDRFAFESADLILTPTFARIEVYSENCKQPKAKEYWFHTIKNGHGDSQIFKLSEDQYAKLLLLSSRF